MNIPNLSENHDDIYPRNLPRQTFKNHSIPLGPSDPAWDARSGRLRRECPKAEAFGQRFSCFPPKVRQSKGAPKRSKRLGFRWIQPTKSQEIQPNNIGIKPGHIRIEAAQIKIPPPGNLTIVDDSIASSTVVEANVGLMIVSHYCFFARLSPSIRILSCSIRKQGKDPKTAIIKK